MTLMKKLQNTRILTELVLWSLLIIGVLWAVFPILYILLKSFSLPKTLFDYPPSIFPRGITLTNYIDLFRKYTQFLPGIKNSLIISIGAVLLTLAVSYPAAYLCSMYSRSKSAQFTRFFIVLIRVFPPIIISIPLYPILALAGLIDTHIALIALYASFYASIGTWVLKAFIDAIEKELLDAALIDGCTNFQVFFRITLPLSLSGLVAVSALTWLRTWNEFLFAFLYTSLKAKTAPVVITEILQGMFGTAWGPLLAATCIQLGPSLIFLVYIQKYLLKGTAFGGLK
jgi:multiple sugar transport system permease protein